METTIIIKPEPILKPLRWKQLLLTVALLSVAVWATRLYLVHQMIIPRRVISFPDQVVSLSLSPDGRTLAVGTKTDTQPLRMPIFTGEVSLWDTRTGKLRRRVLTGIGVSAVAISPDGQTLATVSGRTFDCQFQLWDVQTGRILRTLSPVNSLSRSIAFSSDSRIVALNDDEKVRVWDARTGDLRHTFITQGPVSGLALSQSGSLLACASYMPDKKGPPGGGAVNIYDLRTGQRLRVLLVKSSGATVAFSPDSRWLVTAGYTGGWTADWGPMHESADGESLWDEFNLFDVKTGARQWTQWSDQGAQSVVFPPDSRLIADGDLKVEIRNIKSGGLQRTLTPPWQSSGNWVSASCLAISPDGKTLASRSANTVNLWDIRGLP